MTTKIKVLLVLSAMLSLPGAVMAQDRLPVDNSFVTYHTAPRYRESESHPLRVLAYVLHPIGWVAREVVFRPLSYFASSTEGTRSVMGYREPYDYRNPECFSADSSVPDCRSISPFNYADLEGGDDTGANAGLNDVAAGAERNVYFPDVNFDFNVRALNDLGKGRVRQLSQLLQTTDTNVNVVLEGHTDYIGSPEYNEKLGLDRAEAVRQELIALGIAPERVSTVTFGKTKPIFTEEADWARAINRRVEVHVDTGADAQ